MKPLPRVLLLGCCVFGWLISVPGFAADKRVVVSADALPEYTQKKFGGDVPRPESYVFMEGDFHPGGMVDDSLQKMSFRQVVEWLAPELAKKNYLPVKAINDADLLIVVSWGMTMPPPPTEASLRALTNPSPSTEGSSSSDSPLMDPHQYDLRFDQMTQEADRMNTASAAASSQRLLGYSRDLRRLGKSMVAGAAEQSLRQDLAEERYFLIIKAFDLRSLRNNGPKRSVWTLHVNMGAVGRNFSGALEKIGPVAVEYFGRATSEVTAVYPKAKDGQVDVGEIKVVGDAPAQKK